MKHFLHLQPGLCLHLSPAFTSSLWQHGGAGSNSQSWCVCARPGSQQPGGVAGGAGLISGCRSSRWSPLALGVCSGGSFFFLWLNLINPAREETQQVGFTAKILVQGWSVSLAEWRTHTHTQIQLKWKYVAFQLIWNCHFVSHTHTYTPLSLYFNIFLLHYDSLMSQSAANKCFSSCI